MGFSSFMNTKTGRFVRNSVATVMVVSTMEYFASKQLLCEAPAKNNSPAGHAPAGHAASPAKNKPPAGHVTGKKQRPRTAGVKETSHAKEAPYQIMSVEPGIDGGNKKEMLEDARKRLQKSLQENWKQHLKDKQKHNLPIA